MIMTTQMSQLSSMSQLSYIPSTCSEIRVNCSKLSSLNLKEASVSNTIFHN